MPGGPDSFDDVPGLGNSLALGCGCCPPAAFEPECPVVMVEVKYGEGVDTDLSTAKSDSDDARAEADWSGGPAFASIDHFGTPPEVEGGEEGSAYVAARTEYRWKLDGGNTGYVKIEWQIRDQDAVEVDSGVLEHEWDTDDPLDETLAGDLIDWPPAPVSIGTITSYELVFTAICVREEEEEE